MSMKILKTILIVTGTHFLLALWHTSEPLAYLKVIYHPLYGMNNYALICIIITPYIGVIGYHVTLSEGHMIHDTGNTWAPSCGNFDLFGTNLFILYKGW